MKRCRMQVENCMNKLDDRWSLSNKEGGEYYKTVVLCNCFADGFAMPEGKRTSEGHGREGGVGFVISPNTWKTI